MQQLVTTACDNLTYMSRIAERARGQYEVVYAVLLRSGHPNTGTPRPESSP